MGNRPEELNPKSTVGTSRRKAIYTAKPLKGSGIATPSTHETGVEGDLETRALTEVYLGSRDTSALSHFTPAKDWIYAF